MLSLISTERFKFRATITINGVKIGIDQRGDVRDQMKKCLDDFKKEGCEIIVCACREGTKQEVSNFASEHHYQIEWIDKIKVEDKDQFQVANDATAAQIVSAVQTALGA